MKTTRSESAEPDAPNRLTKAESDADDRPPPLSRLDSTVLAHIGIGVIMLDPAGLVTHANDRAAGLLGIPPALLQAGASYAALIKLAERRDATAAFDPGLPVPIGRARTIDAAERCDLHIAGGNVIEVRSTALPDGGSIKTLTDVGHDRRVRAELHRLATTDPLTGIANRRYFLNRVQREIDRKDRYGSDIALLILDIDHFKGINDRHGHAVGDTTLKAISAAGLATLRKVDLLGRIGGEEFGVLLPKTGIETAAIVADRLRQTIAACPLRIGPDTTVYVTASIGVTGIRQDDANPDPVLARADAALYRAKARGRNRIDIAT